MTNTYSMMDDTELIGIINASSDLSSMEPCVRALCDRHGVSYDGWDYAADYFTGNDIAESIRLYGDGLR